MRAVLKKENRRVSGDSVDDLSPRQSQALELLLQGKNITRTAATLGISRCTVSDWFNNNPRFIAFYQQGRRLAFETIVNRIVSLGSESLDAMEEGLRDPERRYQTGKFILKLAASCGYVEHDPRREDEMLVQGALQTALRSRPLARGLLSHA